MNLRRRLVIAAFLALPALASYALGRYYSPSVITFVVEQSLIEKAPPGTDVGATRSRFRMLISDCATSDAKMKKLLQLSQYLEKVQGLTGSELEMILRGVPPGSAPSAP